MAGMNVVEEPKLAAPGAGLPMPELVVARLMFKRRLRKGTRKSFRDKFESERAMLRKIVEAAGAELAGKRVLIERVRGLEDSSRYWSMWMTLEHLRIVHERMASVVEDLGRDMMPEGEVRTADVKPGAEVGEAALKEFEESCDRLMATFEGVRDLKTRLQFEHPWFGPLDAFGWFCLAAGHMSIHREQMERIAEGFGHNQ